MGTGDFARVSAEWGDLPDEAPKLWALAGRDLTVAEPGGSPDVFLWEHTTRVVGIVPVILGVLEIPADRVDRPALFAGALYHDAGWASQVRDGQMSRWDVLARPTSDLQRDLGAGLVEERLAALLSPRSLEAAGTAIRHMNLRETDVLEAQILAEAENLDEIGPLAIWQMVRQNAAKGRGIEACIEAWHSQQEYHFWEARLDRFRFEVIRKLAKQRLGVLEQFIRSVTTLSHGEDLTEMVEKLSEDHSGRV